MQRRETIAGLFVVVMMALGAAVILHWRAAQPKPPDAIYESEIDWRPASQLQTADAHATITAQLNAFRDDDFRVATIYQSEMLRVNFYSVENFRSVIISHYPAFCHFVKIDYGPCFADPAGERLRMEISLVGKTGDRTPAAYFLRRENGMYRVGQVLTGEEDFRYLRRPFGGHRFPFSGVRVGEAGGGPMPPPPGGPPPGMDLH